MIVEIKQEHFLGRGGTKVVYSHPYDPDLCIKFPRKDKKRALSGLEREIYYLKKHQEHLSWLGAYIGNVETNLGLGYAYQRIRDFDGKYSESISTYNFKNYISSIQDKVHLMRKQLIGRNVVVNDLSLNNIFLKRKEEDFDLILIDGFGNNNFIKIADYSRFFLIKKINRKFSILCNKLGIEFDPSM